MEQLPDSWSDWEIVRCIGEGSYGTVYEAKRKDDPTIRAAIKVIAVPADSSEKSELIAEGFDEQESKTFFNEMVNDCIREVKVMEHFKGMQNIVSIEDYKVIPKEDGLGSYIFIRMEMLTSLSVYMSGKKLSEEEIIRLGIDICTALTFCEERGIIHRDIKPENIFVNEKISSHVFYKLGDFGIAKTLDNRTAGLSMKGSPNYIAPEVAAMKSYDNRVDIYSLGLTLYRLLNNNRLPFYPKSQLYMPSIKKEALEQRLSGAKIEPPSEASQKLSSIILKACSFEPEKRYQSADEMRKALLSLLNDGPLVDPPRNKLVIILLTILLSISLLIGILLLAKKIDTSSSSDSESIPSPVDTIGPKTMEAPWNYEIALPATDLETTTFSTIEPTVTTYNNTESVIPH